MLSALLFIFALAILQPLFLPFDRSRIGWLLALLPIGLSIYFGEYLGLIILGEKSAESYSWVPLIGLKLSFVLDGLSLLFAILVTGIGSLILIFAGAYLGDHRDLNSFFAYLLLFMGSMLGLVLADNLILLFIFWELTSFSSYLLIGFHHEREAAREAALQAFVITTLGGLAMLVGVILLGRVTGSYELSEILQEGESIRQNDLYPYILGLIALGSFTKSAQMPFHFWLPGAMQAPTPISAYLHSATMVNAGIYLMSRLAPALSGTQLWFWLLVPVGGATMLYGAWAALWKDDMKLILAYSTISILGLLFFQLGLGGPLALGGMILLLFTHALYKAALFLVAGTVEHEEGTREIHRLSGLIKKMPLIGLAAGLAALSYAGLPPLLGFWAKEGLYSALLAAGGFGPLLWLALVTNMLLFASAFLVGIYPFWRKLDREAKWKKPVGFSLYLGPLLLALIGLAMGLFPNPNIQSLLEMTASQLSGQGFSLTLGEFHLEKELFLSLLTFMGGGFFIWLRFHIRRQAISFPRLERFSPQSLYKLAFKDVKAFAIWLTDHLQNGYLRFYLFVLFFSVLVLEGWVLFQVPGEIQLDFSSIRSWEWALAILIAGASLATLFVRRFLFAILSMGVVGMGVILLFSLYDAPDLALTQTLVEAQTLVLLVLLLAKLPRYAKVSSHWVHLRDGLLSAAFGGMITMILLKAKNFRFYESIQGFYRENALDLGHGKNIVNVILVDFRGLDTLGEITVLTVAGIGVYSLIKLKIK